MELEQYIQLKEKMEGFERDLSEDMPKLVESLMRYRNIPHVCLIGYTPSFNDGDPCVFTFYEDIDVLNYDCDSVFSENNSVASVVLSLYNNEPVFSFDSPEYKERKEKYSIFDRFEDVFEKSSYHGFCIAAYIDDQGDFHYTEEEYHPGY